MSAYAHQMERAFSAQSLSSRGNSEMESRYMMESGIYMTSFAATVFIAALVTVGISLATLLISLTVMLQSCQSKSAGVVEMLKSSDDYNYCKIYALHAELNSFDANSFPLICIDVAIHYIKEGQYTRDLNNTEDIAENYFNTVKPLDDGLDVVLMDADDLLPLESCYTDLLLARSNRHGHCDYIGKEKYLNHIFFLKLYIKLQTGGWPLILFSRKPEKLRNATVEHLNSAGYSGWSSLIMRLDEEMQMDSRDYFSSQRTVMQKEGFRITAVISSQMDALTGPCLGKRIFKFPNPIYFITNHYYTESTDQPQ